MTFADNVIQFNRQLKYTGGALPEGIRVMNPFREHPQTMTIVESFYRKFYNDRNKRHLILGINPGRFGGGLTGIPFTDTKRLVGECGIDYDGKISHEPSSVFVYEMINAFGGPALFYDKFFINSPCPLGFTSLTSKGKEVNYNYYDSPELVRATSGFIVDSIKKLIALGVNTDVCFCFGAGKNIKFLDKLNAQQQFFKKIIALEHPRFIMQYKSKSKDTYIRKYLDAFGMISS
jgi:hypothetical protein